ncbi:MAG TPA: SAM-dependent chlorinase/fluorinase [Pyrinomonadaceae bacterium]|nr:SAM-dependent chlorinase/fluorinase [Pyrinomonadaceae bacterium]
MLVTLLTDFGTADYFVGAMKGAVLAANPRASLVDLTHDIPSHDIEAGAFTLAAACETFPEGTVHLAVVDPGVGSPRRPLVVAAGPHLFVGPDNGLFTHVYERHATARVFHVTATKYFRPMTSTTFHGRDVFAPVAGALSAGVAPGEFGPRVEDFARLARPAPTRAPDGRLHARVVHVDRFGNCVTNITPADLPTEAFERGASLRVGPHEIKSLRRFFAEDERPDATSGEQSERADDEHAARLGARRPAPFAIWGSAGFLELALFRDSLAQRLGVRRGDTITVTSDG